MASDVPSCIPCWSDRERFIDNCNNLYIWCLCRVLTRMAHLHLCRFSISSITISSYFVSFLNTNGTLAPSHPYDHSTLHNKKIFLQMNDRDPIFMIKQSLWVWTKDRGPSQVILASKLVQFIEGQHLEAPHYPCTMRRNTYYQPPIIISCWLLLTSHVG